METFNVGVCIAVIAPLFIWRYGPSRSAFWQAIKLWAEDNEEAAKVREDRRALRRLMRSVERPAQLDPGMEAPR